MTIPLRNEYTARLNRVVDHISRHLGAKLTLEELAGVAAFSQFHFHRLFSALMGERLGDFITRLRLERAAFSLSWNPGLPVTAIAFDCGFESASGFARAFRRRFGMSALAWRKKRRAEQSKLGQTDGNFGQDGQGDFHYLDGTIETIRREKAKKELSVSVRELESVRVVYLRHWGYNDGIWRVWNRLCRWAEARRLLNADSLLIGVTHDDDTVVEPRRCRYDACLAVSDRVRPDGDLGCRDLEGGAYAVLRVAGPYRKLWDLVLQGYRDLFRLWLPESGFEPGPSPMRELYPPAFERGRFQVDICLPVRPLS